MRVYYQPLLLSSFDVSWNWCVLAFAAQLEHFLAIITASIPALTALWIRYVLYSDHLRSHSSRKLISDLTYRSEKRKSTDKMDSPRKYSSESESDLLELGIPTRNRKYPHETNQKPQSLGLEQKLQKLPALNKYDTDFLCWAYDPERKHLTGNFSTAYATYEPEKKEGWLRALKRKISTSTDEEKAGNLGSGEESMEYLKGLHGVGWAGMENCIVIKSEVEVRVGESYETGV